MTKQREVLNEAFAALGRGEYPKLKAEPEKPAPKVEPEVDNSGHPQAKERDRLDKFLITMMCHVKEVYEANGTPWGEDDEERFVAIRSLILSAPPSVSGADIEVMAGALVAWGRTLGRAECGQETLPDDAPIPQNIAPIDYVIRRLRSLGIRVEGEPEGGGE